MSELCPVVAVPLKPLDEPQAATATEAFMSVLKKKRLCDVTFLFENSPDKIEAHQFCLRARSPVFDSMFRGLGSGASVREVKIEDASPEIFQKFLQFIYADKFDVTTVQALHLFKLGHKYKVEPLMTKCKALLNEGISIENAIEVYETAETYKLSLGQILKDPKLLKAKNTTLMMLLKRNDLTVKETDLFQLALQWGKENSSGDQKLGLALIGTLLPFIRFTNMTPREFTTVVWPTNLLPPEDIIQIYAYMNGDDSTRNEISPSLKYETSHRNAEEEAKFERIITFVSEQEYQCASLQKAEGSFPFKECISFSTSVVGSCDKGKKFRIRSLILRWPTRQIPGKFSTDGLPVNFRVLVKRKHSSHELYTTKFDTIVYDCKYQESLEEVAVEPPVEICHDFDYCIAVVDEYPRAEKRFKYVQDYGHIDFTANLDDYILEEEELGQELHIRETKRNDCPKACPTCSSYNALHVIRDICIVID